MTNPNRWKLCRLPRRFLRNDIAPDHGPVEGVEIEAILNVYQLNGAQTLQPRLGPRALNN
jgi:hypothetical protein